MPNIHPIGKSNKHLPICKDLTKMLPDKYLFLLLYYYKILSRRGFDIKIEEQRKKALAKASFVLKRKGFSYCSYETG